MIRFFVVGAACAASLFLGIAAGVVVGLNLVYTAEPSPPADLGCRERDDTSWADCCGDFGG